MKKRESWNRLRLLKDQFSSGEWCIGGDFNEVGRQSERKSVSNQINREEMNEFNEFIQSMELVDEPLLGKKFTWFNWRRVLVVGWIGFWFTRVCLICGR